MSDIYTRNKEILNRIKSGEKRQSIAIDMGVTDNVVYKVALRAGLTTRNAASEELKRAVYEYRLTHTLRSTAEYFGISEGSVVNYYNELSEGDDVDEMPIQRIRVFKHVPIGFKAPQRGIGW